MNILRSAIAPAILTAAMAFTACGDKTTPVLIEQGERLNTDLRILAIKRMGIDDAASIAQILNYSLNTIYAYRNRLKSRAVDRDNFEENIMKINPST